MTRIDLGSGQQSVRDMLHDLGRLRSPVEIVIDGVLVAKLIPPAELSEREKRRILDEGWRVVEKVRARTKRLPASAIRKAVDAAVRDDRASHDHSRR
jgi:hypothetical protein